MIEQRVTADRREAVAPLRARLGRLAASAIDARALWPVVERIVAGELLTLDEAQRLSALSLPGLGKLVELIHQPPALEDPAIADRVRDTGGTLHTVGEQTALFCFPDPSPGVASPGRVPTASAPPHPVSAATCIILSSDPSQLASADHALHFAQPPAAEAEFLATLVAARDRLLPTGRFRAWYPALPIVLDRDAPAAPGESGWEVLRTIALARLILPATVQVRAPLATLGPKTAQSGLAFGAAHLGLVADDPATAAAWRLPEWSVLAELIADAMLTPLEDPT